MTPHVSQGDPNHMEQVENWCIIRKKDIPSLLTWSRISIVSS